MPRNEFDMRMRRILMDLAEDKDTVKARQRAGGLRFMLDQNNITEVVKFKKMISRINTRRLRRRGTGLLIF